MTTVPSATRSAKLSGRVLGEWIVGESIGSGGFSDVYQARQPRLGRDAVIKVLRLKGDDKRRVERFEAEARLACQLDHPFAAHVYSFGTEADGLAWIAMELVRGDTLSSRIRADGRIPLSQFAPLFERLCEVVHSAHQVGLLHRDIKPANVMVIDRAGRLLPKLLDFGIAEALGDLRSESESTIAEIADVETITATNIEDGWILTETIEDADAGATEATRASPATRTRRDLLGTPAYMAPERWSEHARVDQRSDIYSLAVLAQHCLTGELPFHCTSFAEYAEAHAARAPAPLGPEFPQSIASVIARAVAKDPDERYETALALGQAFRLAADPSAAPRLPRQLANSWLLFAPRPLRASVSAFESASEVDRVRSLRVLVESLAQWIGIVSVAASAGTPGLDAGTLEALDDHELRPSEWLAIARDLCGQCGRDPSRFQVAELAAWFADDDGADDQLLALHALCKSGSKIEFTTIELLNRVLSSLQFLCEYTILDGVAGEPDSVWLADGNYELLFSLTPLVVSRPPTPASADEVFMISGGGDAGATMRSPPSQFEIESAEVWPWLSANFGIERRATQDPALERAPYRGLAPYTAEDAALFFGRNRDVQNLHNRVLGHKLVALTGPSGSGKSSLVHAGLIGRLKKDWTILTVRPGPQPRAALAMALATLPCGTGEFERDIAAAIEWLALGDRRLAVLVDQAEELLALANQADAQTFVEAILRLLATAGDRVRVVLTVRDDFSSRLADIAGWRETFSASLLLVSPPSEQELRHMVLGPAQRVGYHFDDETVVDEMVAEVASQAGALPLLSFAASQLWHERQRDSKLLTRSSFTKMGGVSGALASYAEETLAALPSSQQASVRVLFRSLISGSGTRAWVARSELQDVCGPAVLEHLIRARILVAAESEDGGEQVSVIHEALLTRWPRLVRWREQDAAGLRFRDDLRAAVAAWTKQGREPSYLWSGAALRNLEEWQERWSATFSASEQEFARASLANAKRARRRRRIITAAVVAALSVALVVLLVLNQRVRAAGASSDENFTDLLAQRGYSELVAGQRQEALAYLHAAFARGRDSDGLRLALALSQRGLSDRRFEARPYGGPVSLIAGSFLLGRGELITASSPEPAQLWRFTEDGLSAIAAYPHGGRHTMAVSPTGDVATIGEHRLRIWKPDGTMRSEAKLGKIVNGAVFIPGREELVTPWGNQLARWDYDGNRLELLEAGDRNWVWKELVVSSDGAMVAAADFGGVVRVWSVEGGTALVTARLSTPVRSFAFPTGQSRLFVGLESGEIVVIDVPSGRIRRKRLHRGAVRFQLYANSTRLITESNNAPTRIIDTTSLEEVASLPMPDVFASVGNVVSDPQSRFLAVLDGSRIDLRDATTLGVLNSLDVGEVVNSLLFSSDGNTLFVGTMGGAVAGWDVGRRDAVTVVAGAPGEVWAAARSPDRESIAVLKSYSIDVYEQSGTLRRSTVVAHNAPPFGMPKIYFSQDGTELLAPADQQIHSFDLATGLRTSVYSHGYDASAGVLGANRRVATSSNSRTQDKHFISIYDRDTEALIAERQTESLAIDLEFTPDGERLVYATPTSVGLWTISDAGDDWSLPIHGVEDIDISSDGQLVAASRRDAVVEIWDVASGEVVRTLRPPRPITDAVSFSPSGKLLATSSSDLNVYLWDVEAGVAVAKLRLPIARLRNLEFSHEDALIGTDRKGTVIVWALEVERREPEALEPLIEALPFRLVGAGLVNKRSESRSTTAPQDAALDAATSEN